MTMPMCPYCHDQGCLICQRTLRDARMQKHKEETVLGFLRTMDEKGILSDKARLVLNEMSLNLFAHAIEYGRTLERTESHPPAPSQIGTYLELDEIATAVP